MPIRITNRGKLAGRAELLENVWILRNYAKTLEAVMQTGNHIFGSYADPSTHCYVAGMSDGWWLTRIGNGGPLVAISGHSSRRP
jgi:hypothetical protein